MKRSLLITKAAVRRLSVLFLIIGIIICLCWFTMIRMPLESYEGPLLPLTAEEQVLREELRRHVDQLGGVIGDRNIFLPASLAMAMNYIEREMVTTQFQVRRQSYTVMGERCHNLEIEIPGKSRAEEIVVVGAHYDSVGGCPGANDNASGVAAVLALARRFSEPGERTLRLVAFANEEPPFFHTRDMGSLVYAQACRDRGDRIVAMISLETIGYYTDAPNSQKYPFPLALAYPSVGNFIAFVGNSPSAPLVRECIEIFRREARFPSEGAALPGGIPGVNWSDHWSFWEVGYPAIMITDTAPFRYPYYHTSQDTPDKLDYDRMARVVNGIKIVVDALVK